MSTVGKLWVRYNLSGESNGVQVESDSGSEMFLPMSVLPGLLKVIRLNFPEYFEPQKRNEKGQFTKNEVS